MSIFELILSLSGAVAIGYGLSGLLRQKVEIIAKGQVRLYEKRAAQLVGAAFFVAGLGAFALGYIGISTPTMIFGILCTGAYFALRTAANRVQTNNTGADFSVPSQHNHNE